MFQCVRAVFGFLSLSFFFVGWFQLVSSGAKLFVIGVRLSWAVQVASRKFTKIVSGCCRLFQFVSICSSRSTCLGSTRFFRLYSVVMVRYVLFFYVISILLSCFKCFFECVCVCVC